MQGILAELLPRDRTLVLLSMVTGLRRGERTGLKWQDIDFENLQIENGEGAPTRLPLPNLRLQKSYGRVSCGAR